jgi:hypothetical protein|tara:strand:+ start:6142 stop:6918 length:777 start_codon:yes stop_codon:yes gene_type:complete
MHISVHPTSLHRGTTTFILGTITLLCFLGTAQAGENGAGDPALIPYTLSYAATYNGMDISAERQLKLNGNGYVLTTTAKNLFSSIEEEGAFLLDEQRGIVDQNYQYKRNVLGIKKTEKLRYNREAGVANYKTKKKQRQVTLEDGYLNRLTYQVQLQRDLINQVSPLQYQVISRGRLKQYKFETLGEETLDTPLGKIKALKVRRIRDDDDRETLFWFAPEWNYLLVQLWQREEGGEDYKIVIQEGSLNKQPLTLSKGNS